MSKRLHLAAVTATVVLLGFAGLARAAVTSPTSPVDLATPVHFAATQANPGAIVRAGDARFEVLGNSLIRLEYSPTASFENAPTVNAVHRRFAVPAFTTSRSGGWLTLTTSEVRLR